MSKNQEYVTFQKDQLLSVKQLNVIMESPNPLKVAKVLANCLKQYFLINGKTLYLYNYDTVIYSVIQQPTIPYLTMICRKLVVDSFESLSKKQKDSLEDSCIDYYFSMGIYSDFILDIVNMITDHTIKFNSVLRPKEETYREKHYRNGFTKVTLVNNDWVEEAALYQRDPNVHYISQYFDNDYVVPKKAKRVVSPMDSDSEDEEEDDECSCCDEEEEVIVIKKKQFSDKEIRRIAALI